MHSSDSLYHRLFSEPLMIEQLVRGFLPAEIADLLDFGTLVRVNAKFHGPNGERREGDVVWRVSTRAGEIVHIYLMLEFQGTPERFMAVRVQVYSGLLWQQIIVGNGLAPGGRLPPILPIVLYNGEARWTCPTATSELVALPETSPLWHWQPQIRYHLIDEGRLRSEDLTRHDSLVPLLFRIETCVRRDELPDLLGEVAAWFRDHPGHQPLRLAFGELVRHTVTGLVGATEAATLPADFGEMRSMLAERIKRWEKELREEALAAGLAEGRERGLAEGRERGLAEGRKKGLIEGKAEGKAEGRAERAASMFRRQFIRRFGDLPADAEALIAEASDEQLDAYMDRLMDARSPADVFPDIRQG